MSTSTSAATAQELPTNWGRWGEHDERGTLNLITDEVRARAVAEARTGRSVSLARPVPTAPLVAGPAAALGAASTAALQAALYTGSQVRVLAEMVIMMTHSPEVTHLDSPGHQVLDGLVYPGRPLDEAAGADGLRHASTAIFAGGIVTRGVLLDLAVDGPLPAGYGVTDADLDRACDRAGVQVSAGDAIVVRGGWNYSAARARNSALPGMSLDAVAWMHRHDVSVYAGDIGDAHPFLDPLVPAPLHRVGLARLGMPLIDVAAPDELAAVCAELGRYSFLLVAAPPPLPAASGVPVNPIAVF